MKIHDCLRGLCKTKKKLFNFRKVLEFYISAIATENINYLKRKEEELMRKN